MFTKCTSVKLINYRVLYFLFYKADLDNLTAKNNFSMVEFSQCYDLASKNTYIEVKKSIDSLSNLKIFKYEDSTNKEIEEINVFDYLTYVDNYGNICYKFSDEFIHLYNNDSTIININKINRFSCKYSFAIYHLILMEFQKTKSHKNTFSFTVDLSKLRLITGATNIYPKYNNFKVRVIDDAIKDISEKSNVILSCEPFKKYSKKVTSVKFTVTFK